ncbi:FxsA family protein [Pseudemcibacter aquimaris]|uniref:FxsA family protein n=1 Tax=Pseudemcibacter aquimaris TaxID=2857064 RepID=UPI002011DA9C|nr:FxsA family protein [Pseudemcibacter aquimaris]MCC3861822.1 FxsA family protein [Pseudemcibacter aquimaris]WDU58577.1 FxsA family protein [Pseudemcibacter aquimaris]
MPLIFLITFVTVIYMEFIVFAEVADGIGTFSALLLTILTAVLGIYIIRQEGIKVLLNMKQTVDQGESPVKELIHGFFLAVAGFFFLLPGFITDSIAILFAIAPIRAFLGDMMVQAGKRNYQNKPRSSFSGGIIIDGEFEEAPKEETETQETISEDKRKDDDI